MIFQEILKDLFYYDGKNLIRKQQKGKSKANSIAGTINSRGYRHIRINDKFYQSHRLIWIYHYGSIPNNMIVDHINRNRLDNSISNLRLTSRSVNNRNTVKSDHKNVNVWKTESNKYQSSFNLNNKRHYIGLYNTEEEAINARLEYIKGLNLTI